ncbi:MAG: phosphate ABC transporter substrate-binding protein PstS [Pseudomonadota bacterium]
MYNLRKLGAVCLLLTASLAAQGADIKGAGSSAAQPLYAMLAQAYAKTQKVALNYQPSGSSDGLAQIKGKTVDFGATDIALDAEQRKAAKLVCVPTAIFGVVPVVNLPGVRKDQLQLNGDVLADIFARKIVRWNDEKLRALNRGLTLPDLAISVIARADGSGTTYNFSDYLGKANAGWKNAFGRGYLIAWPEGVTQVKGSSGVVAALKQTSGAIAYVDHQYAVLNSLAAVALKNRDGQLVHAGPAGFSAALINSAWLSKGNYEEMLTDRPGAGSWPITSGTFILIPQVSANPDKTIAAIKFFTWGFMHGDDVVGKADFVRLPEVVQGRIFAELTTITGPGGAALAWSIADALK